MEIAKKLEEVKSACFALKKYDKSSFNRDVDDASILNAIANHAYL